MISKAFPFLHRRISLLCFLHNFTKLLSELLMLPHLVQVPVTLTTSGLCTVLWIALFLFPKLTQFDFLFHPGLCSDIHLSNFPSTEYITPSSLRFPFLDLLLFLRVYICFFYLWKASFCESEWSSLHDSNLNHLTVGIQQCELIQ